jgi:hypothetical protein
VARGGSVEPGTEGGRPLAAAVGFGSCKTCGPRVLRGMGSPANDGWRMLARLRPRFICSIAAHLRHLFPVASELHSPRRCGVEHEQMAFLTSFVDVRAPREVCRRSKVRWLRGVKLPSPQSRRVPDLVVNRYCHRHDGPPRPVVDAENPISAAAGRQLSSCGGESSQRRPPSGSRRCTARKSSDRPYW